MQGEFGDLVLSSTLCRTFKELNPNSHLTWACNKKYSNILPLFYNNPYIDGFHIWQNYEGWPGRLDWDYISRQNFDIVYPAMPTHKDESWFLKSGGHNISEIHNMYGFHEPKNKQCYLNRWFDLWPGHEKTITASVFASGDHPDQLSRTFTPWQIKELFHKIESMGYRIKRLDMKPEPILDKWPASILSLIDATKLMLSSRLHITCDTSWSWIADGYSHNTIGWARLPAYVPVNPKGYYFINQNIQNIPIDLVVEKVKEKLKEN